jgi:TetR/AcrR family transcriptional regulator, transcriptional repressor of bet genes
LGRPSNTEERRTQLVRALMRVIVRYGYAGASIQEIAKEAGMRPGLIHYHFESKQEILLTLFSHLELVVGARLEAQIQKLGAGHAREAELDALIDAFLALDKRTDQLAVACWTIISAEAVHNAELRQLYLQTIRQHQDRIEELLRRALPAAKLAKLDIKAASASILAAIHGSFLLASAAPGVVPKGSAAASVKRMVHGLLR